MKELLIGYHSSTYSSYSYCHHNPSSGPTCPSQTLLFMCCVVCAIWFKVSSLTIPSILLTPLSTLQLAQPALHIMLVPTCPSQTLLFMCCVVCAIWFKVSSLTIPSILLTPLSTLQLAQPALHIMLVSTVK